MMSKFLSRPLIVALLTVLVAVFTVLELTGAVDFTCQVASVLELDVKGCE